MCTAKMAVPRGTVSSLCGGLRPACAHFRGAMPKDLRHRSQLTGRCSFGRFSKRPEEGAMT